MVHKKYIKRGDKIFGPYLYENYRVGNKTKTRYLGKAKGFGSKKFKKKKQNNLWVNKNFFILLGVFSLVVLLLLSYSLFYSGLTGRATLDVAPSYILGENLTGNLKIGIQAGELLPVDSKIIIQHGDFFEEILLNELIESNFEDNFYVKGSNITGSGLGYGFIGEKKIYPEVFFTLKISDLEEVEVEVGEGTGVQKEEVEEEASKNETTEVEEINKTESVFEEQVSQETTETPVEEKTTQEESVEKTSEEETTTQETETKETTTEKTSTTTETAQEKTTTTQESTTQEESTSESTSSTESSESAESEASTTESTASSSESSESSPGSSSESTSSESSPASSESSGSDSGAAESADSGSASSITGEVIGEEVVYGNCSKDNDFIYTLNKGKTVSIEKNSVEIEVLENGETKRQKIDGSEIKLSVSGSESRVTTEYFIVEEGFGEEFLEEERNFIELGFDGLGILAQEGELVVRLVYNETILIEAIEEISVEGNGTLVEINETELNETIIVNETNVTEIGLVDNISTIQYGAVLGKPVKWKKKIKLSETKDLRVGIPKEAVNVTVYKLNEVNVSLETNETELNETIIVNETSETINETNVNQTESVINETEFETNKTIEENKTGSVVLVGNVVREKINANVISGEVSLDVDLNEDPPIVNFFKNIFGRITGRVIEVEETEIVKEVKISDNATEYEIEYETPGPISIEENITKGKKIVISSETHYENILAYTQLDSPVLESKIKLYHIVDGKKVLVDFISYSEEEIETEETIAVDLEDGVLNETNETSEGSRNLITGEVVSEVVVFENETNETQTTSQEVKEAVEEKIIEEKANVTEKFVKYIEWVVPHLSNQTYELIIEITKAEHLDENRMFISDIYDDVKALDGNFSEVINDGEYVRVVFEIPLDSSRDITVYPRGNGSIEVYEVNGTEIIAEFGDLIENEYNKVYLTNLNGTQDTFDLKIVNGNLEFDHIIDPAVNSATILPLGANTSNNLRGYCNATDSTDNAEIQKFEYKWYNNSIEWQRVGYNESVFMKGSISIGGYHVCAIRANDSRVLCWGNGDEGELGNGSFVDSLEPILTSDTSAYLSLSAGWRHVCAIRANDSRVLCWGDNAYGQLGNGSVGGNSSSPLLTSDTSSYLAISSMDFQTCGIRANDSRVLCWGNNDDGNLGNGSVGGMTGIPQLTSDASEYIDLSLGIHHSCGIRANDSRVLCWGNNTHGQLGNGSSGGSNSIPQLTNDNDSYISIDSGGWHTCGIRANDSRVLCWGIGTGGRLGDGVLSDHIATSPNETTDLEGYMEIGAGYYHTCAIRANDSRVLCWGEGSEGRIGDGDEVDDSSPKLTLDSSSYFSVSSSIENTCGIRVNDSRVLCWGVGSSGVLGNSSSGGNALVPQLTSDSSGYSSFFANNKSWFVDLIDNQYMEINDGWIFSCRAWDGISYSDWSNSSSITIISEDVPVNISLEDPTPYSGDLIFLENYFGVNVSFTGINVTVDLYNSTKHLVNSTTNISSYYFVNFTNLNAGVYYFNATAMNSTHSNTTITRNVLIGVEAVGNYVLNNTKISDGLAGFSPSNLDSADSFGYSIANIGDLDGDGIQDLVVGAVLDENGDIEEGAVYILFMYSNETVKDDVKISDGLAGFTPSNLIASDYFGSAVANIGDLDNDGVQDLAVGAYGDENSETSEGAVYILFMFQNGTVKDNVKISDGLGGFSPSNLNSSDYFGYSIANIGDLDNDGIQDLAVGAYGDEKEGGDSEEGALYILFMFQNGTVKDNVKISDGLSGFSPSNLGSADYFGGSVANIGDLDNDGIQDLAVGAYGDENSETSEGAVYILFMFQNGTVKDNVKISDGLGGFSPSNLDSTDYFGYSIANAGDLDNDGIQDLAVGAVLDENSETSEGAVYILFMFQNGTVKDNVKISDGLRGFTPDGLNESDYFGSAVANIGDLDNDGIQDLAVGAYSDEKEGGDVQEGAIYVLNLGEDLTPPTWSANQINETGTGEFAEFAIEYDDGNSLHLGGSYIFSTNNTGSWVNDSLVMFSSTPQWANVTKTLNLTAGNRVDYRWYANDSRNNINNSDVFSVIITDTINPEISIAANTTGSDWLFINVSSNDNAGNHSTWIDFNRSLVGYWSMDAINSSGYIWDNSSYGNDGQLYNHSTNETVSGVRGQGLDFDGSDDYVRTESIGAAGISEMTMTFWMKTTTSTGIPVDWGAQRFCRIGGVTANKLNCAVDAGIAGSSVTTSSVNDGAWHFIALTSNSSNQSLYFDGILEGSASETLSTTSGNFNIGSSASIGTLLYDGEVDEVMLFNRRLDESEVLALYNAQVNQFYTNITGLSIGDYNYTAYAVDMAGNRNDTGQINISLFYSISGCSALDQEGATYYLTDNILNSGTSYCINISANNVVFDGQGYTIEGNGPSDYGIYLYRASDTDTGVTIKNVKVSNWDAYNIWIRRADENILENVWADDGADEGIMLFYADDNSFNNVTISNSGDSGLYARYSENNNYTNCNFTENFDYDVLFSPPYGASCTDNYTNVTGSGGYPIEYYNSQVSLSDETFSTLILCNADDSNLENITIIGSLNYPNNYLVTHSTDDSNFTDINSSNNKRGINLLKSYDNIITNVTTNNNLEYGIYIGTSRRNNILDSVANSNTYGLYISDAGSLDPIDNNVHNLTARYNQYGIYFDDTGNTVIANSTVTGSTTYGLRLSAAGKNGADLFYNNYFNNSVNTYFETATYDNSWNTTPYSQTNIIGNAQIGGNYWITPEENGWSDNCSDSDSNGFCDAAYTLTTDNVDYFPLIFSDTTSPTWRSNQTNQTIAGLSMVFAINYTDETALHPNGGYIFSTNNTGSWVNDSLVMFSSTPQWANVTKTLNSTAGNRVDYRWYANDSAGNVNNSDVFNVITTDATNPEISIVENTTGSDWLFINVSSNDNAGNHSTWIDFNRSLVGYWAMDYTNSTGVYDNSSYERFATFYEGLSESNKTGGARGNGLDFDGSDDYVRTESISAAGISEMTMTFWMKTTTSTGIPVDWGAQRFCRIGGVTANKLNCAVDAGSAGSSVTTSSVNDGEWHFIALTSNSSNQSLYFDGILEGSASETLSTTSGNFNIGSSASIGTFLYDGEVDEVMLFNRRLDESEVLALYNAQVNQFYTNITGLSIGDYNYTAYAVDMAGNRNDTGQINLSVVASNNAPNNPSVNLQGIGGTNKTTEDLNCSARITDDDGDGLDVSVMWYNNGVLNLSFDYNNSYSNNTLFNATLDSGNTSKNQNWTCSLRISDGTLYSDWVNSSSLQILNSLPTVTLTSPDDGNSTTNRTPTFTWTGNDDDGDNLEFELNLTCYPSCSIDNRAITGITSESHTLEGYLLYLADNNYYYNWSVRARDDPDSNYSEWSSIRRININSEIITSLINDTVSFGALSDMNDTTDNNPFPFLFSNDGNCLLNVTINATNLWNSIVNPSDYFQFKADNNSGEEGSFNWDLSQTDFAQVGSSPTIVMVELNWSDAKDTAEIDVNVSVPDGEGSGNKESTIYFVSSLGE